MYKINKEKVVFIYIGRLCIAQVKVVGSVTNLIQEIKFLSTLIKRNPISNHTELHTICQTPMVILAIITGGE